ncbi:hypothetical protein B566_EDAN004090 [Ephemera danica]|nr:hypothetical protein B566_EDAN004090 [Ephemera danica]
MNLPNFHNLCGYHHALIDAFGTACLKCIPSCLRRHHQVHPVLLHNDNCEFLQLHPQRRIRVIHFNPAEELDCVDNAAARKCEEEVINPHEDSATDDYWFIRCSHSSFRLLKKKARDQRSNSRSPEIIDNHDAPAALNNVRYSFHRRKKLKSCIEEDAKQSNQKTSVDAVVNSLLSTVLVEAIAEAASLLLKRQRCHPVNTSVECLPQHSVTNQTVNNKQLHNGKPVHHIDEVNLELSGCVNQVFTSEEKELEEKEQSSILKSESQLDNKTFLNESNRVSQEEQVEIRVKKESGKGTKSKKSSLNYNSKPVLLFLHGAGSSAEVWSHLLTYFATAGYEVIAPDLLGHGFSSTPGQRGAYTFACLLQDALQIFDTFITEPRKCVIIGHAYG